MAVGARRGAARRERGRQRRARREASNAVGGWDLHELRSVQDWTVRYVLQSVDGVSEVSSVGGYVREYPTDEEPVDLTHLPWPRAMDEAKRRFGRQYLCSLLREHHGRVADAASAAEIERESFYRLMRRHDVDPGAFRE